MDSPSQIEEAIHTSIEYAQCNIALFFKSNYPKEFANYFSLKNKNQLGVALDVLSMKGGLDVIKLIQGEISPEMPLNVLFFLQKSVQYNQTKVFEHWLHYLTKDMLEKNISMTKELIYQALYYKGVKKLKIIVDKFNLDLSPLIPYDTLRVIIELAPESLSYIIHECGYSPSAGLVEQITTGLNQLSKSSNIYKQWGDFVKLISAQKEKENLARHISNVSGANVAVNKI